MLDSIVSWFVSGWAVRASLPVLSVYDTCTQPQNHHMIIHNRRNASGCWRRRKRRRRWVGCCAVLCDMVLA